MVEDVTDLVLQKCRSEIQIAVKALSILKAHFGRETVSAAVGEITEVMIAKFTNAKRVDRGRRGHDLIDRRGNLIEVKSRTPGRWGDSRQFNFGRHSAVASQVYCVAWDIQPKVRVTHVFRIPIKTLQNKWGKTGRYCARVNLRQLIREADLS